MMEAAPLNAAHAKTETVMNQASETVGRGRRNGAARGALKARTNDVLGHFADLRKDMGRLADAASKAARHEVRSAGHRLEVMGRDLRTRAGNTAHYVSGQVRVHPGAAIGISVGAGVLIGLLLRGRGRHRSR
jgi:ElaB/YqjD/DUF883 family membrane-anchored ribosome-binding protein